jgi:hypothetical protein
MIEINTKDWKPVGTTSNTHYYDVEDGILAAVPNLGSADDRKAAVENVEFQDAYWHKLGRGGVVLVFFDRLVSQSKEARQAYGTLHDLEVMRATALIGGSVLGRTIASFFLGLFKPQVPVKMFGTTADALTWARQVNRLADAKRKAA